MKSADIVKEIRGRAGLSQGQLAKVLGVSFATVNRWENGHCEPTKVAMNSLRLICIDNHIDFENLLEDTVVITSDRSLTLYHGSRKGIKGKIRPISNEYCDFGRGFYMCTNKSQPAMMICDFPLARLYTVKVDLAGLKILNVEVGMDWAMLAAFHRGQLESIKGTGFYKKYENMMKDSDVISGYLVNEQIYVILEKFLSGEITDAAFMSGMNVIRSEREYVAVSEKACGQIRIIEEEQTDIRGLENTMSLMRAERREELIHIGEICRKYRREGRYFDEIIKGGIVR